MPAGGITKIGNLTDGFSKFHVMLTENEICRVLVMGQKVDNPRYQNEEFLELLLRDLKSDVW